MESSAATNRQPYLDMLRVLAILLVLFNHTGTAGYFRFAETANPALSWCYLTASIFCTAGVPLFYMVSGALLLPKTESLSQLYRRRVLRTALALLLFSLLQYLYNTLGKGVPGSPIDFLRTLYGGQATLAYWFLYAYLAALMTLPFLRSMAAGMTRGEYRYFFILYFAFCCALPVLEELLFSGSLRLSPYMTLPLTTASSVVYMLLGHYLNNVLTREELTGKRVLLLCLMAALGLTVSGLMTLRQARITGVLNEQVSQGWFGSFTVLSASAAFCLIRRACGVKTPSRRLSRVFAVLSGCTFGLYLIHVMLMDLLIGVRYYLEGRIYTLPACLVYLLCVAAAGYGITWLLKKIPFLGRLL